MKLDSIVAANEATVMQFLSGTHSGRLEVIDATVAKDIVTEGFPGGFNPYDRDSYKQFFRDFGAAFANMRFETLAKVADADRVAVHFLVEVTHVGPFAGAPPTGRRVRFTGIAIYRMRDGLIAHTTLRVDELGLLSQIGALGAAAAA